MNQQRPKATHGPPSLEVPTRNYTQVNILFPSVQVELPSADKFKAFPPEAQKAIIAAFEREQVERHSWLKNQQSFDFQLNMQEIKQAFYWRISGLCMFGLITLAAIFSGTYLVHTGANSVGVTLLVGAFGGVIGTAFYGHKATSQTSHMKKEAQSSGLIEADPPPPREFSK